MKRDNVFKRIFRFYYEGFAAMDVGKTLWLVIIVKLFIIFAVLKMFFMPDVLGEKAAGGNEADYVSSRIVELMPK